MQRLLQKISVCVLLGSILILTTQCGPDSTPVLSGVEVTDITEEETIQNRITQQKTFNQCSGGSIKAEIRFSQASGEEVKQALELGADVGISQAAQVKLSGEIEKRISSQLVHDESVEINVPSHTQLEYTIVWQEVRREGTVHYRENGESKTADYSYRIGLEFVSSSSKELPCPGQTESVPTNTPVPPTATPIVMTLQPDADLSRHYWTSQGGGSNFFEVALYHYRAGVSHVEDLPVAGQSISLLTFNISAGRGKEILNAWFDLSAFDVIGNPFGNFGDLIVEEVSYSNFGFDVIGSPSRQEIARLSQIDSELEVTQSITDAIGRGSSRFQIRMRFADVDIVDELTQPDDYVEWDTIRLVIETR